MCLIVDANVDVLVLLPPPDRNFQVAYKALFKRGTAMLVHGGPLTKELLKNGRIRQVLRELDRAGRATYIASNKVNDEIRALEQQGQCLSNDLHIIALARLSRARLLCSDDGELTADFKNKALLARPRGRVYHSSKNENKRSIRNQPLTVKALHEHCSPSVVGGQAVPA